ncbi:DUF6415 family natural product biosynthesis protein [Streptomyces sp. cg36]|uniref:DUF6415 family natural product biosynthesis protein n=1 Tax=Streptomyces sp. cg36 TaxID=3238798 RepID=UPI0034E28274
MRLHLHERLLRAVLSWTDPAALPPDDYEQVGLLLTGAGHSVADNVRQHMSKLPPDDPRLELARIVLGETDRRLTEPGATPWSASSTVPGCPVPV